jgi:hypothetical protein
MERAALLICCSKEESAEIQERARRDRRKISSYMLSVLMPSIEFEEALFERYHRLGELKMRIADRVEQNNKRRGPFGKSRTAMLLRCSKEEGSRIRAAAQRRDASISQFVVFLLRRSWAIADRRRKTIN